MPDAIKIFAGNKIDLRDENNMKNTHVAKETVIISFFLFIRFPKKYIIKSIKINF